VLCGRPPCAAWTIRRRRMALPTLTAWENDGQRGLRREHAPRVVPAQRHDHHFMLRAEFLIRVLCERLPPGEPRGTLRHRRAGSVETPRENVDLPTGTSRAARSTAF